ncbi:hypothetical protein [Rouxiella badensis]|uniref:hypothetical protein n=1 Tax=Rouxiella badensis TaxID=1646377 RepID=UPI001787B6D7|nr:hypothetical protein [Rouxiella badensis]QOI56570.1 hypothetical protein H2866_05390 [Rouxiella badensis subsp. acadiensis]
MLMSKAAYAKHCGVSRQTVYDWIAKGEVVMCGTKIDAVATEGKRQDDKSVIATQGKWENRTLEMTWGDFWKAVKAKDGQRPPTANDDEIQQRVREAAGELGWEVDFLEDGGIYLDSGDIEHYCRRYGLRENAELAIELLRRDVCYTVAECPDDLDDWSLEGLSALSEWAKG